MGGWGWGVGGGRAVIGGGVREGAEHIGHRSYRTGEHQVLIIIILDGQSRRKQRIKAVTGHSWTVIESMAGDVDDGTIFLG